MFLNVTHCVNCDFKQVRAAITHILKNFKLAEKIKLPPAA